MAHKITLEIEDAKGIIGVDTEIDGETFAGGIWRPQDGSLDIDWLSDDGDNVIDPSTGQATKSRMFANVWTIQSLWSVLKLLAAEK